ncbi:DNA (cytosine-5)-methyltransferase CMT2 [Neltuma alba]|uniref:DNA (cytosine-5)-methyltransferase CMT2 n=1 Tax=Neltuma alba TaxID=207710 RepID=UPI0010A4A570|nr:DNA (cytosine-5)-methyltransferase CMT2-like [Prosopis alba]
MATPESSIQLRLRRSPRFTPIDAFSVSASPNSSKLSVMDRNTPGKLPKQVRLTRANGLRRSPRINPDNAAVHTGLDREDSGSSAFETVSEIFSAGDYFGPENHATKSNYDILEWQRCRGQDLQLNGGLSDLKTIAMGERLLRRSPRLSSTQSECEKLCPNISSQELLKSPETEKGYLEDVLSNKSSFHLVSCSKKGNKGNVSLKHDHLNCSGAKDLRKSPRLSQLTRQGSEASMENLDRKMLRGLTFRRSPRLSSSSEEQTLNTILQQQETSKVVQQKKRSLSAKCASIKLSNSPNEQHSKAATTSGETSLTPSIPNKNCMSWFSESTTPTSDDVNCMTNCDSLALPELGENPWRKKLRSSASLTIKGDDDCSIASFIGDPIPDDEALKLWGWRYELKDKGFKGKTTKINEDGEDETIINVERHYAQARIGNCVYSLGDCAFIKGEGEKNHVGKIVEFFQTTNGENYFRVQWFYRIEDTVVQGQGGFHDERRLFYSSVMNDNLIDCLVAKVNVTYVKPRVGLKLTSVLPFDFYYDMEYCVDYSTFRSLSTDSDAKCGEVPSAVARETLTKLTSATDKSNISSSESDKEELALLDLFSGCGGMSTGLCLGAKVSSVNLVTKWAVDSDGSACESLKLNHPETHVRNESAEEFLELLKEWEKLCKRYKVNDAERTVLLRSTRSEEKMQRDSQADSIPPDELEVSRLVDICYGDPSETGKRGLYFKVRWRGYSPSEDTWEPMEGLRNCQESIKDFVRKGMGLKILPLPGAVDVICGGPPCQGISGYNRFRNATSPLDDERNHQIVVFMDIVEFLKPKYVLMENVSDLLKFDNGSLGRYALSRLVHMNYQARLGLVAAGCYGLPQFRLRVFLWGAHPSEVLPQFPLPTHEVIVKYWPPPEFERNTVALDEGQPRELEKAIVIQDAISDLPAVTYCENSEELPYQNPPATEFQRYIRSSKYEMTGSTLDRRSDKTPLLYDHRCCHMDEDNYLRVCQIPKVKGANFRDLPGVVVGADNVARRDPNEKPVLLPSGKPLVPDFCFTFEQGKSKRPFSRLWWDETISTVLTCPHYRAQTILHPEQDRVLSLRECARLQGFPDYYQFCGTVNKRYCQVGNAVAIPVARALGFALGMAHRKLSGDEPLLTLPPKFSLSNYIQLKNSQKSGNTDKHSS